jgi:hypothetical protein
MYLLHTIHQLAWCLPLPPLRHRFILSTYTAQLRVLSLYKSSGQEYRVLLLTSAPFRVRIAVCTNADGMEWNAHLLCGIPHLKYAFK